MPTRQEDIEFLQAQLEGLEQLYNLSLAGHFPRQLLEMLTNKKSSAVERAAKIIEAGGMDGSIIRKAYAARYDEDMTDEQRSHVLGEAVTIMLARCTALRCEDDSGQDEGTAHRHVTRETSVTDKEETLLADLVANRGRYRDQETIYTSMNQAIGRNKIQELLNTFIERGWVARKGQRGGYDVTDAGARVYNSLP
jgi:hypothetical protein